MQMFFPVFTQLYTRILKVIVLGLAVLAGSSVLIMILLPCLDIVLRHTLGKPIPGVYDLVQIAGLLAISFGLPYTTAVKGHVAVEFLYHKLSGPVRVILELVIQATCLGLFAFLTYISIQYGNSLLQRGVVMPTSQIPLFWMAYVIALNSFIMIFVFLNIFLRAGKEMIKP